MQLLRQKSAPLRAVVVLWTVIGGVLLMAMGPASAAPLSHPVAGGYDVSWPQCPPSNLPVHPKFGIVGASNGLAYSDNPCLKAEYKWAKKPLRPAAFYLNTADPGAASVHWTTPGPKPCGGASDDLGCAYNYGWNAASHAFGYAGSQTGVAGQKAWWLDIETSNTWSSNTTVNNADIQGMLDYFHQQAVTVGIYSTSLQWSTITGGAAVAVPNWVAGAASAAQAASWCHPSFSFTGGPVTVVQYPSGTFDGDVAC